MQSHEYLRELIPFSSVSCDSNTEITECVERWLVDLDFEIEKLNYVDESGKSKSCLVSRKGPKSSGGLAYFGHTDVVPVNSWSFSSAGPWTPYVTDGRMYGRGACDMRGSLACMLAALHRLRDVKLAAPIYYVITADEEVGMIGAHKVVKDSQLYRQIVSDQPASIVGEPTSLDVVYAHKGGRAVKATSIGKAAHSSTGLGVNANFSLIPFLVEIQKIHEEMESSEAWRDQRFVPPTPTLNLLVRDANTGINITSALSECLAYFRPMPGQDADNMVDRLRTLALGFGLKFDVLFAGDPLYTDPSSPFVQELLKLAGQHSARTAAYGTDGAIFTELKNIVVFGPGDIAQAHTDDEWISLEQLRLGTDMYAQCVLKWCC